MDRRMTMTAFRKMCDAGMADFTPRADQPHNVRAARCRVCCAVLVAGQGHGYDEYMTDGYRFSRRYVCGACFLSAAAYKS